VRASAHLHRWSRRHVGILLAVAAILCAGMYVSRVGATNSLPTPGWLLTAAPTTNLTDGQQVTLNIRANPDVAIAKIVIRQCRFGPTYTSDADMDPTNLNCSPIPVSSSQQFLFVERSASAGLATLARTDKGAAIPYYVGEGVAAWSDAAGTTLTCDATNPCALVAKVIANGTTAFQAIKISFTDSDPVAACGGAATGALNTAAGDEVSDAWANWTRNLCQQQAGGAASRAAFTGEGAAVSTFAQGDVDLAYTSAGYSDAVGLSTIAADSRRKAVAVPVAINAAVIATGGGQHQFVNGQPSGDKAPYAEGSLALSAGEVAAMLGGGQQWLGRLDGPYVKSVPARNPDLAGILYSLDGNIQAPSQTAGSTYFLTDYLHTLVPNEFVDPFQAPPPKHVANPSLALAQPAYGNIALYTGRPALRKVVIPASLSANDGPLWTMTDLASARALGLTPVSLPGAGGQLVFPTKESMQAAVADMKSDTSGVLLPDATKSAEITGTATATANATVSGAYPLAYVVYALVPAEPLVNTDTCTLRNDSQALLQKWLTYVTADGQQNLPDGMAPLTPALQAQAQALVATVGTAPVTGKCAGLTSAAAGSATGTGAGAGVSSSGSSSSGSANSFNNLNKPTTVAGAATGTGAASGAKDDKTVAAVAVPAFAGRSTPDPLSGVIALLGIVLLTTLGAWVTAGGELGGSLPAGGAGPLTPRRVGSLALLWTAVAVSGVALVMFQLGPMLEQRDQQSLLSQYKSDIRHAAAQSGTLQGVQTATAAPESGAPVGILEIGTLKVQDVVVEGVKPSQTRAGPGHVPGTSGLGQSGNAVVLARRNGYGGSFAKIGSLRKGERIVVTTTQGQSVYAVARVCTASLEESTAASDAAGGSSAGGSGSNQFASADSAAVTTTDDVCAASGKSAKATTSGSNTTAPTTTSATSTTATSTTATSTTATSTTTSATSTPVPGAATSTTSGVQPASSNGPVGSSKVTVAALYGASTGDQLTLVTSAARTPWNSSEGTVVVAKLLTKPFAPTPQGARSSEQTGLHGDSGAWATVVLALLGFAGVVVASVFLYRKLRFRIAYLLTIAPLVALTIVLGESVIRLLPAWA